MSCKLMVVLVMQNGELLFILGSPSKISCIVFCSRCIHVVCSFIWMVCMWVNLDSWAGRLLTAVESCRPGHVFSQQAPLTPVRRNVYLGTRLPGCCKCHWLGGWTNRSERERERDLEFLSQSILVLKTRNSTVSSVWRVQVCFDKSHMLPNVFLNLLARRICLQSVDLSPPLTIS